MRTRLFCVSDTHGKPPPQPEGDVVACLHGGDFYNKGTKKYRTLFGPNGLALLDWAEANKTQYYSVRGNHDGNDEVSFFSTHSREVTGAAARLTDDLVLVGVGWNGSYHYDLPNEEGVGVYCNQAMNSLVKIVKPSDSFVVLSHYPAWTPKVFGRVGSPKPLGWMFDCVKELVDELKPIAVVAGHVHELSGKVAVYDGPRHTSLLVFPGPVGGILTVDTETMAAGFVPNSPKKP